MKLPALNIPKHKGERPHVTMKKGQSSGQIHHFDREEIAL